MAPPPPPPPTMTSRIAILLLRFLTFAFLIVSLVVLTTNTANLELDALSTLLKLHFKDIYAYRYMLASIVFGLAYTLLQIAITLFSITSGNRVMSGDGGYIFDFYGDKVISYVLATGAAAGFGATKDMKSVFTGLGDVDKFFNKGYASASLLLLAFVCTALLSILSSYALPKRVT